MDEKADVQAMWFSWVSHQVESCYPESRYTDTFPALFVKEDYCSPQEGWRELRSNCSCLLLFGRSTWVLQKCPYPGEHLTPLRAAVLPSAWSCFWVQGYSSCNVNKKKKDYNLFLVQDFLTWCSLYWFFGRAVTTWFRKDLDQNWNTTLPCGWLHYKCILQLWPPSKLRKYLSNI